MPIYRPRQFAVLCLPVLACALAAAPAAPAGPGLWQIKAGLQSDDPARRAAAAAAAGSSNESGLGDDVVKLVRADPDPEVRSAALQALIRFNPPPPEASAAMIAALADPDAAVRKNAIELRPRLRNRTGDEMPYLRRLLVHPAPDVRATAALALADFTAAARDYLPAIEQMYNDPETSVREAARNAAEAIRNPSRRNYTGGTAAEWLGRLSGPDPAVRMKVIAGLAATGDTADTERVVEALIGRLADTDESVRYRAAWALLDLAPRIPALRKTVRDRLGDPDPKIREMIRYTLDWMPGEYPAGGRP